MAQVKRGASPATSLHGDMLIYTGSVIGPGAASAPTLPPAATLAARDNFVASATYTSTGLYVLTLKEMPGIILDIDANLHRAAGTTLFATVRSWDTALKTVTIDVRDGASSSAVAQATVDDRIAIIVYARNSTS